MKLEVPFVRIPENTTEAFVKVFDQITKNKIGNAPWAENPDLPHVEFGIVHTNKSIVLQYRVSEKETRAVFSNHNDPVYRDSCVEFFISFEGDPNYYNFEFNSHGTCLAGWGKQREGRKLSSPELIEQIWSRSNFKRSGKMIHWQLTISIPNNLFLYNNIEQLSGKNATANFYKCGDDLSTPHFLCWSNIKTPNPDFHQPSFFGEINFL